MWICEKKIILGVLIIHVSVSSFFVVGGVLRLYVPKILPHILLVNFVGVRSHKPQNQNTVTWHCHCHVALSTWHQTMRNAHKIIIFPTTNYKPWQPLGSLRTNQANDNININLYLNGDPPPPSYGSPPLPRPVKKIKHSCENYTLWIPLTRSSFIKSITFVTDFDRPYAALIISIATLDVWPLLINRSTTSQNTFLRQ